MDSFTRRQFLEGSAALLGVSLAGCGAQTPTPAASEGDGGKITLTGLTAPAKGEGTPFKFPNGEPGLLFQSSDGVTGAVSAKCTHAGCTVEWEGRAKIPLRCPCHESQFALDGKVLSGPAKAPLKHYSVSAKGDTITLTPL